MKPVRVAINSVSSSSLFACNRKIISIRTPTYPFALMYSL